jgi:hypothetical protein
MKKRFNVTGLCLPNQHYMANVSKKLARTLDMIENGDYFIINRPRQYGKTTTLYTIEDTLVAQGDYIVLNMSFEGTGDLMFAEEKSFSQGFVELMAKYAGVNSPELEIWLLEMAPSIDSLKVLSNLITTFVNKAKKKVVILIDEVDKSSNNQLFVSFLAMLRNKYLERSRIKTFHSVVLAGVHDVKSMKLIVRPDEEKKLNSPWNIAAEFNVDMNLHVEEIKPMLEEYCVDNGVKMDTQAIAERLFYYTSGYPFLVSLFCKTLDEDGIPLKNKNEWRVEDIDSAYLFVVKKDNTNFETQAKNIENNQELYDLVYKIVINSEQIPFNRFDSVVNFGTLYGIFDNKNGLITIHNRVYIEVLVDYMTAKMQVNQLSRGNDFGSGYKNPDKTINMEAVMTKFQGFMREQYSRKDRAFLERNGRLVFLAFIKPIINGSGFDFKEPQISEERRLDVIITYLDRLYLAELKIWRGEVAHEEGLLQLFRPTCA